jgi:sugar phosphate isomerase/epimerase
LHDNHGGTNVTDDLHLPIGQGRVDFPAILQGLKAAGYNGGFSLELKSEHVEQGRDAIRKIWTAASLGNAS